MIVFKGSSFVEMKCGQILVRIEEMKPIVVLNFLKSGCYTFEVFESC